MKKSILIVALLVFGVVAYVNDPTKDVQTQYIIRDRPSGTLAVYEYGNPFEPKYLIKPSGRVYRPSDPFQSIGNIKDGVRFDSQKGGK